MTFRITLLIPALLVISTLASSIVVYSYEKHQVEANIRKEIITQVKLDITRLQNVLYNRLTETASNIQEARLNLSVTAMDPMIRKMFLTDENERIVVSNRYLEEGSLASQDVARFDQSTVNQVKQFNAPIMNYLPDDDTVLQGYFPVVLSLESEHSIPVKRVGILYVEVDISHKLALAFRSAAFQSLFFAVLMLNVSLLVAWLLHQLISKRLNHLSVAASQLATGDLDARSNLTGKDELGTLGQAFDKMATQIKSDIVRRQKAEEDLRLLNETLEERVSERTRQLQEAQRIGQMGNWRWDLVDNRLYWSDEIYRIFGYQPGEVNPSRERFDTALYPEDVAELQLARQDALTKGNRQSIDHRIFLDGGEERWVHEEIVSALGNDGKPIALTGTIQDITARKLIEQNLRQAKEEAEQASKAKSVFLSRMSHELRTPLNAILGFSQILQMEEITDQQQSFVSEIRQAGNHLLVLIDELLDLSRIEAGRFAVDMTKVILKDVIEEAITFTRGVMENNQLQLNLNFPSNCSVHADKIRLRQVLVNILSNAAKYNKIGGEINIACEFTNDKVKVTIADSGIGIKAENLEKLFIPFERIDAENSNVDGSGIGLALSKQIIELMSGRIGVNSKYGSGSTFWIELQSAQ